MFARPRSREMTDSSGITRSELIRIAMSVPPGQIAEQLVEFHGAGERRSHGSSTSWRDAPRRRAPFGALVFQQLDLLPGREAGRPRRNQEPVA